MDEEGGINMDGVTHIVHVPPPTSANLSVPIYSVQYIVQPLPLLPRAYK